MSCPHTQIEPPPRIKKLPIAANGFHVPYFVQYIDGVPDFRVVDPRKLAACVNFKRCWICGDTLGAYKAFVVGPMGYVNRISADAYMHAECALYAVQTCPFMINPNAKRREDEITKNGPIGGVMIEENPGVMCLYVTKRYSVQMVGNGPLFTLGPAESAEWWAKGKAATSDEIEHAFAVGCVRATAQCSERERDLFREKVRGELSRVLTGLSNSLS